MAFPNTSVTDIIATTLERRSGTIADNTTDNNAVLAWLKKNGRIKLLSGGRIIYEELNFAENPNGGWYQGYDTLPVGAADVITAAEYNWKQLAVPITVSGAEIAMNSGREQVIDLLEGRIAVGESTMKNLMSVGIYSDGTGTSGKQLTGLAAAVPTDPTTGTYGNINRATATNTFWRSQLNDNTTTSATILGYWNALYAACTRGADHPDLIVCGSTEWGKFLAATQAIQRFTDPNKADVGFPSLRYMHADVVLDGGIGGNQTATVTHMLNTNFLRLVAHKDRNMRPLSPEKRYAVNQDAHVTILGWMGNLTCSGAQFQGKQLGD